MTYRDIAAMATDQHLRSRLIACAATQDLAGTPPPAWVTDDRAWRLAASPGWADAWSSALAAGNVDPGNDPGVITDGMILSAVQAALAG